MKLTKERFIEATVGLEVALKGWREFAKDPRVGVKALYCLDNGVLHISLLTEKGICTLSRQEYCVESLAVHQRVSEARGEAR